MASDNIVSYAFFLYQSLGFDSSSNGQYAIAAIESGGGFTNIVKDVHAVSGTEHVSTLPDQDGNVVEGGVAQKGYFIMDIDSMRSKLVPVLTKCFHQQTFSSTDPALLAMKVSEMMAQLEMMMTVVQALPEKPVVNPYTRPAAVQAANPYCMSLCSACPVFCINTQTSFFRPGICFCSEGIHGRRFEC